jgi:hypothetical protein
MPLDEMRTELRALKKQAGGNISKMKKADLERQLDVYRDLVHASPKISHLERKSEKTVERTVEKSKPKPKERISHADDDEPKAKPTVIKKAPKVREEEDSPYVSKSTPKPILKKPVEKKASEKKPVEKSPKKMTIVAPESGSEFEDD